MKKSIIVLPIHLLLMLGALSTLSAQTSLPIKKVTVFKNATAMLVKEGNAAVKDGSVGLAIPEQTLFGAFFIGSGKDNAVKNVVFKNDTLKRKSPSTSVWQFLAGNVNKAVTIAYTPTQGIDKTVSGKVLSYDLYSGIMKFAADGGKTMVMNVNQIYQADFKEDPTNFYMADSIKRMMVLKPEKAADNIALQEIYMTGGINWIPSYYLKLKDDKSARLEMKATVENYAEDLKDAETELVVGAPQMSYSGKMDPMTYDYLTVSGNVGRGGYAAKSYLQSNAMAADGLEMAEKVYFDNSFSTEGEKMGDMYIYKLGKITLPNQSKGSFPIFAGNVDYKDKYEGTVHDITNYFNNRFVPQDERIFDIFHSLEVKNTSSVPLTTASVMVLNEKDQFVAQDELKYTPVGSTSNIRLSKAIDIIMKNSEDEKNREDNAKKIGKVTYSKVILKGSVNVDNFQNKEVTVSITKSLSGTVLAQSDGAKVTKVNSYNYINPNSNIKWEVNLKANEKKTLTYEYEVYFVP
ncbi:MAG: hypothetical protein V4615_06485 [Bacteroidota bacterium]